MGIMMAKGPVVLRVRGTLLDWLSQNAHNHMPTATGGRRGHGE